MSAERRRLLAGVAAIWAVLVLLGAASLGWALVPGVPFRTGTGLAIVAVQAGLVLRGFMRLGEASALARMAMLAGAVWLGFLFLMSFADLWTR